MDSRPEWENAEKGKIENGTAEYKTEKNVWASESKGLSCFLYNSIIITDAVTGIRRRNHSFVRVPDATRDDTE